MDVNKHTYSESEPTCIRCGAFGPVADSVPCATQLQHAQAALRHIARVCDDPELAQFAHRASTNPPDAYAPECDYETVTL